MKKARSTDGRKNKIMVLKSSNIQHVHINQNYKYVVGNGEEAKYELHNCTVMLLFSFVRRKKN